MIGQSAFQQCAQGPWKVRGAAHIPQLADAATPLLLHLPVVEAKESFPLLKACWQRSVPNLLASRQLSYLLQEEIKGDSHKKHSLTLAEANSLTAATCLIISLGFLATHLTINLHIVVSIRQETYHLGGDCAVADVSLPVEQESGSCQSSSSRSPVSPASECQKYFHQQTL